MARILNMRDCCTQELAADIVLSVWGQYRHATDLVVIEDARTTHGLAITNGEKMRGLRILIIPFVGRVNLLFVDKNRGSNGLQAGLMGVPRDPFNLRPRPVEGRRL